MRQSLSAMPAALWAVRAALSADPAVAGPNRAFWPEPVIVTQTTPCKRKTPPAAGQKGFGIEAR
ncbi:hypothetical protein GCM10028821_40150 [Hymenobacter jeollabukensis]